MNRRGKRGTVEKQMKVCSSCQKENELVVTACWKCGAVFETGTAAKTSKASYFPVVAAFAVVVVLFFGLMALSKDPAGSSSGGKKPEAADLPPLEKIDLSPIPEYTGSYHLQVTSLPDGVAGSGGEAGYVEGLIEAYLGAHAGAVLLDKNPVPLSDPYRALEYKIGFKPSGDAPAGPFIHHAITVVVAGKAYTVSVDYTRDFGEKDAVRRKELLEALPKF